MNHKTTTLDCGCRVTFLSPEFPGGIRMGLWTSRVVCDCKRVWDVWLSSLEVIRISEYSVKHFPSFHGVSLEPLYKTHNRTFNYIDPRTGDLTNGLWGMNLPPEAL